MARTALHRYVGRDVLVALDDDLQLQGRLEAADADTLTLAGASLAQRGGSDRMDGLVVVERARVLFVQVP